jgi:hypothetical protein
VVSGPLVPECYADEVLPLGDMPCRYFASVQAVPCTNPTGRPMLRASKPRWALRAMNALANSGGGAVLFGVDERGIARGFSCDATLKSFLLRDVANIFAAFRPVVPPEAYDANLWPLLDRRTGRPTGRSILAVLIFPTGLVHNYLWRIYVQNGTELEAVELPEELQLLRAETLKAKKRHLARAKRQAISGPSKKKPALGTQTKSSKAHKNHYPASWDGVGWDGPRSTNAEWSTWNGPPDPWAPTPRQPPRAWAPPAASGSTEGPVSKWRHDRGGGALARRKMRRLETGKAKPVEG